MDEQHEPVGDDADELLRRALIDPEASVAVAMRVSGLALTQARVLRDALLAADTVLAIWREPLQAIAEAPVGVDRSVELQVRLPAHRLMPVALVAPDKHITVAPVCGARTLAEGRPPMGIACAQQDVARVYPLPDDPERCLEDFAALAADHARRMADRLEHQEASVRRFLELSGEDSAETA